MSLNISSAIMEMNSGPMNELLSEFVNSTENAILKRKALLVTIKKQLVKMEVEERSVLADVLKDLVEHYGYEGSLSGGWPQASAFENAVQ